MSGFLDYRDWERLCDDLERLVDRLRSDGPEVLRRGRIGTRGVYPTATTTVRVRRGSTADPTGDTASESADLPQRDPVRHAATEMVKNARQAARDLLVADSWSARTRPPAEAPDTDVGHMWCVNCFRYGFHEPVRSAGAGRCGACYDYRLKHDGADRPEHLIRSANGERRRRHVSPTVEDAIHLTGRE